MTLSRGEIDLRVPSAHAAKLGERVATRASGKSIECDQNLWECRAVHAAAAEARASTTSLTITGTTESAMATSTRAGLVSSRSPRLPTHGGAASGHRERRGVVGRRSFLKICRAAGASEAGAVGGRRGSRRVISFFSSPFPSITLAPPRPSISPRDTPQNDLRPTTYGRQWLARC